MTSNAALIRQLRAVLQLTKAEEQIARARTVQARTDAVRSELRRNADNAEHRSDLIATELRAAGGVPDVVSPIVGRFTALFKSTLEQAVPFEEALLGDLALEQQLLGRARYIKALAEAADRPSTRRLAEHLESAHTETIDWIGTVLAEEALGGPAALRATPLQRLAGGATLVVNVPARVAREQLNRTVDRIRGGADRVRGTVEDISERAGTLGRDAGDVLAVGRDAALARAETVARRDGARGTADTVRDARRELGALDAAELPVADYDGLSAPDAVKQVKQLDRAEDVRAVLRYEQAHKDRTNVVSAAQTRLAAIARETVGIS